MKIISVRNGLASDHSSTSYSFLAVDYPLSKEQRKTVATISRRAKITARVGKFFYGGESDMSASWEDLMFDHYDVMYTESYDWWTLAMAFEITESQFKKLQKYQFDGTDDCGISVERRGSRALVSINCRIDVSEDMSDRYDGDSEDEDEDDTEDEDIDDEDEEGEEINDEEMDDEDHINGSKNNRKNPSSKSNYNPSDPLLSLLMQIRSQLINRDYRALYVVWEKYFLTEDMEENEEIEELPPKPKELPTGQAIIDKFSQILTSED